MFSLSDLETQHANHLLKLRVDVGCEYKIVVLLQICEQLPQHLKARVWRGRVVQLDAMRVESARESRVRDTEERSDSESN
jgi:hypothetical protein